MSVVRVDRLTRRFGDFVAVDDISFEVYRGEIFGFLGANGAGKSTTIRMLCGILPPTSGNARLLDIDVGKNPHQIKQSIGYMSQKFSLYADLTVKENIELFGGIHRIKGKNLSRKKEQIIAMADLDGMEDRITGELPGGWKQKLALGCALIHDPGVLFLDEPTAGVDPAARRVFWDIIHNLREQGTTVFVTSHYMDEVQECDRVAMMHRGRIAALDTPEELKRSTLPGSILEVRLDSVNRNVRSLLQRDQGLVAVDPFGSGYHVVTDIVLSPSGAKKKCKELQDRIQQETGSRAQVSAVDASLEDVFVYLIGSLDREGRNASQD